MMRDFGNIQVYSEYKSLHTEAADIEFCRQTKKTFDFSTVGAGLKEDEV